MSYCTQCGEKLEEGNIICPKCGTKKENESEPVTQVTEEVKEEKAEVLEEVKAETVEVTEEVKEEPTATVEEVKEEKVEAINVSSENVEKVEKNTDDEFTINNEEEKYENVTSSTDTIAPSEAEYQTEYTDDVVPNGYDKLATVASIVVWVAIVFDPMCLVAASCIVMGVLAQKNAATEEGRAKGKSAWIEGIIFCAISIVIDIVSFPLHWGFGCCF